MGKMYTSLLLFFLFQLNASEGGVDERPGLSGTQLVRNGRFCPLDVRDNIITQRERHAALDSSMAERCPTGRVADFKRMFDNGKMVQPVEAGKLLCCGEGTCSEVPELAEAVDWGILTQWRNDPGRETLFMTPSYYSHSSHSSCLFTCWNEYLGLLGEELARCVEKVNQGEAVLDEKRLSDIIQFMEDEKDYRLSGYVFFELQVEKLKALMEKQKREQESM